MTHSKPAVVIVDPVSSGALLKQVAIEEGYAVLGAFTASIPIIEEWTHCEDVISGCSEVIVQQPSSEEIVQRLSQLPYVIKGIIAGTESGVEIADQVAHIMGLIGNPLKTALARRDKLEMRQVLRKEGLQSMDFQNCFTLEEVRSFACNHTYPLVIKTPRGAGSQNVFICEDWDSLESCFGKILGSTDLFGQHTSFALIEEYIDGPEYAIDLFCDGKNAHVTDVWIYEKGLAGGPKNLYWSAITIDPTSISHLIEYTKKVVFALGIYYGPAHAEVKDDPKKGPMLIEAAARLPGGGWAALLYKASNFDVPRAILNLFTQGHTQVPEHIFLYQTLAIAYCPTFKEGIVKKIGGIDAIRQLPSYFNHTLFIQEGKPCKKSTDLVTIPLFVALKHKRPEQIKEDIRKAHQLFYIETI